MIWLLFVFLQGALWGVGFAVGYRLAKRQMPVKKELLHTLYTFKTPDHPGANGRRIKPEDAWWNITFPIDKGGCVIIRLGAVGMTRLRNIVLDDLVEEKIPAKKF